MAWLCEALGVSRSGFHAWLNRSPSARSRELTKQSASRLTASFVASDRTYGARRVWRDVLADGFDCGLHQDRAADACRRLAGAATPAGLPKDEGDRSSMNVAPNLLDRQFVAERPNQKWIADFTYIWTAEGWLYVVGRDRPVLAPGRRLVDEAPEHDSSIRCRCADHGVWRRGKPDASDVRFQDFGRKELFTPLFGMLIDSIAHRWRRSAVDVGDQALMRGLATALPRCVRGCPYLTSGVEQVGHIASVGNSPAVAPSPPVRERWRLSRAGFPISDC